MVSLAPNVLRLVAPLERNNAERPQWVPRLTADAKTALRGEFPGILFDEGNHGVFLAIDERTTVMLSTTVPVVGGRIQWDATKEQMETTAFLAELDNGDDEEEDAGNPELLRRIVGVLTAAAAARTNVAKDAARTATRKVNSKALATLSVGKKLPHDVVREIASYTSGPPKRFTPQSAKGRTTRKRKGGKQRKTLRRRRAL